jgi:hypothetical protein
MNMSRPSKRTASQHRPMTRRASLLARADRAGDGDEEGEGEGEGEEDIVGYLSCLVR